MNKKVLTWLILAAGAVIVVLACVIVFRHDSNYVDYVNDDELFIYYDNGQAYVSGYEPSSESGDEMYSVLNAFAARGYRGGISTNTLDDIGEGIVPEIAKEHNANLWYIMTADDGVHYAVVVDGEVYVD